ncbi:MAG: bifunctional aldolase/short-chain dehydrogenase [Magnetococcales bacterium]|nr:bifunctional aldolase/short-chain dehydrogenase [Magnetococcales bacterium]MBF0157515.1 bifunctional aldolase/short-chain dehydrogenase [Magnetococcales bacterium]
MENRWSDKRAAAFVAHFQGRCDEELALRTFSSRLLGMDKGLVLHGGGNTSVKGSFTNLFGERVPAVFVKASGLDLATIDISGHPGLDLEYLKRLRDLAGLSDLIMAEELRRCLFSPGAPSPSIEALLHAFLPPKYIDHTHADTILALTNRQGGEAVVREALGETVSILPYFHPGFQLAKAAAEAFAANPRAKGMVLMKHGLLTWGETAKESYEATIELVNQAERYLQRRSARQEVPKRLSLKASAVERFRQFAPRLRGAIAVPTGEPDRPFRRVILKHLASREALTFVSLSEGRQLALTPPLTADHLIRTKALPLWVNSVEEITPAVAAYANDYRAYLTRFEGRMPAGLTPFDPHPRVIFIPGIGVVCAGFNETEASIARDITAQTLAVKLAVSASGNYEGLGEADLFSMEYFPLQHAKLASLKPPPLQGAVALVTGAAGAIGAEICRELLANGAQVAATDLPSDRLEQLVAELDKDFPGQVIGVTMDVTEPKAVADGFAQAILAWGGVDIVIPNAGLAHVASLAELDPAQFRKLERVNVEGTLHVLAEASRLFAAQGTGGDIILISTKNVFAPGARFGAYSATKAAAHQLARIASLEMAPMDVRVNMVAPDGVFGEGARKSGLWAEVGPDRMRARGLDEAGLEAYYRDRNLLKTRIEARHVARAVLFFATRQTPCTGVTLPVDGGLPDATPR